MEKPEAMLTVEGRILKRHHFSKNMMFYDLALAPAQFGCNLSFKSSQSGIAYTSTEHYYTFASVSVQRNGNDEIFPDAIVGDIVRVRGQIHNTAEYHSKRQRLSLDVNVQDVETLESYNVFANSTNSAKPTKNKQSGQQDTLNTAAADIPTSTIPNATISTSFFSFDKAKMGNDFQTYDLVELSIPTMAIQVGLKQLDRFVVAFRDIFGDSFDLRESSTGFSNSSDRLLTFRAKENVADTKDALASLYQETLQKLVTDPTLGPSVLRLYPGFCGVESTTFCATRLAIVIHYLADYAKKTSETSDNTATTAVNYRLQCYPKAAMTHLLSLLQPTSTEDSLGSLATTLPLHPTQYTHVAYVYLCDGIWVVSAVPRAHCFIGDLREKKPAPISAGSNNSSTSAAATVTAASTVTICRAGAKIEEIMRRKHWIYDSNPADITPVLHRYRLAVDVGASPGGWSYFLATQALVERVIAIDKGELRLPEPWPVQLYYWCMHGEDASTYLASLLQVAQSSKDDDDDDDDDDPNVLEGKEDEKCTIKVKPPQAPLQQHPDHTLFSAYPSQNNASDATTNYDLDRRIDLYCCDANIAPTATTNILLTYVHQQLLAVNARIILTFKNPFGKNTVWYTSVQESIALLRTAGFVEIEELHLLANTAKETTFTAIYRPEVIAFPAQEVV